eukprot:Partr_v1_DN25708_c0_g1_i2_m74723 putative Catalyzes the hydroxylation of the N(6)-(4-aminobutyl)- L-lysine intermediate to form hypusine, an essential post- translational modification only found in mature eIF-5A factor (By similarity)
MVNTTDAELLIKESAGNPQIYQQLSRVLCNIDGQHELPERFRALFALKNLGTDTAISCIERAFDDESALLKHELAYVLGQIGNIKALPTLERVLRDVTESSMVRHEAAEAMGAIGDCSSIDVLKEFAAHSEPEVVVRETCELALEKILNPSSRCPKSADMLLYRSVDPAPPFEAKLFSVAELRDIFLDEKETLFVRYRAMFTLRNDGGSAAVAALSEGLRAGKSELFRHEVAFVFGQMLHPESVPALKDVLNDTAECDMVRHECAEALGSIATDDCLPILEQYAKSSKNTQINVVAESCVVALDMLKHESDPDSFHYALHDLK